MFSPIACMMCAVDPATTSLLLPLAQATLISAPILLRGHIRRGIRSVRRRHEPATANVADGPIEATERRGARPDR